MALPDVWQAEAEQLAEHADAQAARAREAEASLSRVSDLAEEWSADLYDPAVRNCGEILAEAIAECSKGATT